LIIKLLYNHIFIKGFMLIGDIRETTTMKPVIVLPTYNEAENLEAITKAIFDVFRKNKINGAMIVVDDDSPDGTGEIADALSKIYPLKVIHRVDERGLGSAYIRGFVEALAAGYDVIFEMDADFSHDPNEIPNFLKKIGEGNHLVLGSRYVPGAKRENCPWYRNLISNTANYLIKFLANLPEMDSTTGYRAYRREVFDKLDIKSINSTGYEFQMEMLYKVSKLGFKVTSIPITFKPREKGESKMGFSDMRRFFTLAIRLRFGKNK